MKKKSEILNSEDIKCPQCGHVGRIDLCVKYVEVGPFEFDGEYTYRNKNDYESLEPYDPDSDFFCCRECLTEWPDTEFIEMLKESLS